MAILLIKDMRDHVELYAVTLCSERRSHKRPRISGFLITDPIVGNYSTLIHRARTRDRPKSHKTTKNKRHRGMTLLISLECPWRR